MMFFGKGMSPIPGNSRVPISGFHVQLREVVRVPDGCSGQCLAIDGEDAKAKWVGFCVVLLSVHFKDFLCTWSGSHLKQFCNSYVRIFEGMYIAKQGSGDSRSRLHCCYAVRYGPQPNEFTVSVWPLEMLKSEELSLVDETISVVIMIEVVNDFALVWPFHGFPFLKGHTSLSRGFFTPSSIIYFGQSDRQTIPRGV